MSIAALTEKIKRKEAKLAVIGLGYVGLPVACTFAEEGFDVLGVDILDERIEKINKGISPIEGNEPGLEELMQRVVGKKLLRATTDYAALADRDVILISVETPVDEENKPQYVALRAVLASLAAVLKKGALVIIESTIAPGTMHNLVLPALEEGGAGVINQDFYLGNCPERVMPGRLLHNLRKVSRVAGAMTPESADAMLALYGHIVEAELDATDCTTAELVKTVENAYRDVQIAFANEVALISEAVGGDVWKVRELVNKSPGRNMLLPGAGVGGHCIPKDPWLLAYGVNGKDVPLRLIPAARAVNEFMPTHIADMLEKAFDDHNVKIQGQKILVLGYSYLENSDDTRDSPSAKLVDELHNRGTIAVIHDPFVEQFKGDIEILSKDCAAAVLMVKHDAYKDLDFDSLRENLSHDIFIDGRGMYADRESIAGISLGIVGRGSIPQER